jgi:hypothetical protein
MYFLQLKPAHFSAGVKEEFDHMIPDPCCHSLHPLFSFLAPGSSHILPWTLARRRRITYLCRGLGIE